MKKNSRILKVLVVVVVVLVVLALAVIGLRAWEKNHNKNDYFDDPNPITSFEDCKSAGYPIQLSYPEVCAADGQSFVNPAQTAPAAP